MASVTKWKGFRETARAVPILGTGIEGSFKRGILKLSFHDILLGRI
jgi:hypothetical protein